MGLVTGLVSGVVIMMITMFILQITSLIKSDPSFSLVFFISSGILSLLGIIWIGYRLKEVQNR